MASTSLTRTPSSNGSQRIMTFSTWLKRGDLGIGNAFFSTGSNSNNVFAIYFVSEFASGKADSLQMEYYNGSTNYYIRTNRKFRDTSAWYHIVGVLDTTDATESNRMRLYVNNVEETSFDASAYPTQNFDVQYLNSTSYQNNVGNYVGNTYFGGSLAHTHFIDGTVYSPSTFGETDATTGIWKPKTAPSVTYGTNGFFLKFENSGAMGTDSSGNGNNFTVSGTMTQLIDTPSNVFATLNPNHRGSELGNATFSIGNTKHEGTSSSGNYPYTFSTLAASKGKYYAEFKAVSADTTMIGIASGIADSYLGGTASAKGYALYGNNGNLFTDGSSSSYGSALSNNDILGVAMDLDNNKLYFHKNGTYHNSGDPTSGSTGTGAVSITAPADNGTGFYHFACGKAGLATTSIEANFGNGYFGTTAVSSAQNPDDGIGIFEYDVPAGYRALCTKSINAEEYS